MSAVETPTAKALRALQVYDELAGRGTPADGHRYLLIEAMTALGEELGLDCSGAPDGWNADSSVAYYSHDGATCPVHEWLVPEDYARATERGAA